MKRREALRLAGGALAFSFLPAWPFRTVAGATRVADGVPRLFFDPEDVPRIRANAQTPLLAPHFEAWRQVDHEEARQAIAKVTETGDLLSDFRWTLDAVLRESLLYLITGEPARKELVRFGIETTLALPKWDYLLEDDTVLGLMRASLATKVMLFAREVLAEELDAGMQAALLQNVADKGCAPCYLALWGMAHKEEVVGWRFDDEHQGQYEISMDRWPWILDQTNLKAIPTMGLGLGALAVLGQDDRAEKWLDRAVASARAFLDLYSPDGSYFEGVSYVNYALHSLFLFLEAHYRTRGDIDWIDEANFYGLAEHLMGMQTGLDLEGKEREIVNFSDARRNVYPAVPLWIANHGHDGLAQYLAEQFSSPAYFADFLWYHPQRPATPPPDALKNQRFDLDWVVCRTGWAPEDSVLAFRSGMPANHEHADRNSFLFKAYGERLLTDPYGAAYDWRQPGWPLRLTAAHNAVLLDGQGHQYHNGEEGTNAGQAEARIVRYVDRGDVVWWCSNATHGYALVDPDVTRVLRSVLFAKPNVVIVFDQIDKADAPSTVAVRFHPENRDDQAGIEVGEGGAFTVRRPKARLHGRTAANVPVKVRQDRLELPDDLGRYPFVEVLTEASQRVEVATVLVAQPAGEEAPPTLAVEQTPQGWSLRIGARHARIDATGSVPELVWG